MAIQNNLIYLTIIYSIISVFSYCIMEEIQSPIKPIFARSSNNFNASGTLNSTLYTTTGNWDSTGNWTLVVNNGKVTFTADMTWQGGSSTHTHSFKNFKSNYMHLSANNTVLLKGTMDVETNGFTTWQKVPSTINIEDGKIIHISVDDKKTDNHFAGQAIHGTVNSLNCATPGSNMEVSEPCQLTNKVINNTK